MDWNLLAALLAVCISVLSPVITELIRRKHELAREEREYYTLHRADVIEGYLRSAGAAIHCGTNEDLSEHGHYYGEIYFYIPQDLWPTVDALEDCLRGERRSREDANSYLRKLAKALSEYPPRVKSVRKSKKNERAEEEENK